MIQLEQHLNEPPLPFRRNPEGSQFYESPLHQEAIARLEIVVQQREFGVLTGEIGSGKSTIIRRLVAKLNPLQHIPIYICLSGLKPKDFYGEVLRQVGEVPPFGLMKAKRMWEEQVQELQAQAEKQWVVIIDEAQDISESMFQELRYIRNQDMDSNSSFSLLLVGQPEIRTKMRIKKNQAISQRVSLSYHLNGMSEEETSKYIRHQLNQTEAKHPLYTDGAIHKIYAASQGIPRVINNLCLLALHDATYRGSEVVEDSHIIRILQDQERQRGTAG
jgi:type II secretory pathway predicted ATPase ExeA